MSAKRVQSKTTYYLKKKSNKKEDTEKAKKLFLKIDIITVFFISFAIGALTYLLIMFQEYDFIRWCYVFIALILIGIIGNSFINKGNPFTSQIIYIERPFSIVLFIIGCVANIILMGLASGFAQEVIKISLTRRDVYFFYLSAGVAEEIFFRLFLMNLFMRRGKGSEILIGIFITSFLFMFAHIIIYGSQISLMVLVLFYGLILSTSYAIFRDINICILSHLIVNFIAVGTIIIELGL